VRDSIGLAKRASRYPLKEFSVDKFCLSALAMDGRVPWRIGFEQMIERLCNGAGHNRASVQGQQVLLE